MRVDDLQSFISLSLFLNFRRAASYLNVSQPTLSRRIECLESEVGVRLIERKPSVRLTAAGKAFLRHAMDAVACINDGMREARAHRGESDAISLFWFPNPYFDAFFEQLDPTIHCNVVDAYGATCAVEELLQAKVADVIFYYDCSLITDRINVLKDNGIACTPVGGCSARIVTSESNPIAAKATSLTTDDLSGACVVSSASGSFYDFVPTARRVLGNPPGLSFRFVPKSASSSSVNQFTRAIDINSADLEHAVFIAESPSMASRMMANKDVISIDKLNGRPIVFPAAVLYRDGDKRADLVLFLKSMEMYVQRHPLWW